MLLDPKNNVSCDMRAKNISDQTALDLAISMRSVLMVKLLLDAGTQRKIGVFPCSHSTHYFVPRNSFKYIPIRIFKLAHVTEYIIFLQTLAFNLAISMRSVLMVKLLLDAGTQCKIGGFLCSH